MIYAITYSDINYRRAAKLNVQMAKKYGADFTKRYSKRDLSSEFKKKNKEILSAKRGAGYWIWKPYIILEQLSIVNDGDYVIYSDAGTAFVRPIAELIDCMEKTKQSVMCFQLGKSLIEKEWSKRDALVLMDCDKEEIINSPQIQGGVVVIKKDNTSINLVTEWLRYCEDIRIVSDCGNVLGNENYDGFKENRHDQTVWSLLCKKHGLLPFRSPLTEDGEEYNDEVRKRSNYPVVLDWHHMGYMRWEWQLNSKWYRTTYRTIRSEIEKECKKFIKSIITVIKK